MPDVELQLARPDDLDDLLSLVAQYHAFEGIESSAESRARAVTALVADPALGRIWLIRAAGRLVGYIAVCFGYSIEFGGRDAFIDEFFIAEDARGQGIGATVLATVGDMARDEGIAALHLEVARANRRARALYARAGFAGREKFHLMTLRLG